MSAEAALLECIEVGYDVGKKRLVDRVSFSMQRGERCAIVGPNGAGKTTLLNLLLGQLRPSSGEVLFQGELLKNMAQREIAKHIAYVPQLLAAEIPYTVLEFVAMGRYAYDGSEHDAAVRRAMDMVAVTEFQDRVVSTLSGGERQRVCIAAALAQEAPMLVLDEPLSHLDPGQKLEIRNVINKLPCDITVLVVTHDMDWLLSDFERVLCMNIGKLAYDINTQYFLDKGVAEELYGHGIGEELERHYKEKE